MGAITLEDIHKDLVFVKQKITEIEEHITDTDCILTDDDIESLHDAEKDLKEGKTIRLN
jgi:hypothetical protein